MANLFYLLFSFPFLLVKFIFVKFYDLYFYIKDKKWRDFNMYGLYTFTGLFGSGKTYSMVDKAYRICKRYKSVKILTNLKIEGFPEWTEIIKLTNYQQIVDIGGDTLILLDEASSIFNSRDWDKKGLPPDLISLLLQVRKEKKVFFMTAQRFLQTDKLMRDITYRVVECSCFINRWNTNSYYDAFDYELGYSSGERPQLLKKTGCIQSAKGRLRYDTFEMIDGAKKKEFISQSEILQKNVSVSKIDLNKQLKKLLK